MTHNTGVVNTLPAVAVALSLPSPLAAMGEDGLWGIVLPDRSADPREAKRPRDVSGRALASTTRFGWTDLMSAALAVDEWRARGQRAYLARRLDGSGLICVDVDGPDWELPGDAWAARVAIEAACREAGAWTEVSLSGEGRHYWLTGPIPDDVRSRFARPCKVEVYGRARMIIVTGTEAEGDCGAARAGLWTAIRAAGGISTGAGQARPGVTRWSPTEEDAILARLEDADVVGGAAIAMACLSPETQATIARGAGLLAVGIDTTREARGMDWDWSEADHEVLTALWRQSYDHAVVLRAFLESGMFRETKHAHDPIAYLIRYVMPSACRAKPLGEKGKGAGDAWRALLDSAGAAPPKAPPVDMEDEDEEAAPAAVTSGEWGEWGDWWDDDTSGGSQSAAALLDYDGARVPMLWRNYLKSSGLTMLVAPPSAGKSTLGMSLAYAVATRGEYLGERIAEGAVVLYVPTEDHTGSVDRLRANARHFGQTPEIAMRILTRPARFNTPEGLEYIARELAILRDEFPHRRGPCLMVVDTLVGAMMGTDENAVKDVQPIMENMNATFQTPEMRALLGPISTLVIHHSGKNAANGPRGSSAIYGAADAVWRVDVEGLDDMYAAPASTDRARVLTVQKIRGCPLAPPRRLDMHTIILGQDFYGEPVTATCLDTAKAAKAPEAAKIGKAVRMPEATDCPTISHDEAIFLAAAWSAKQETAAGDYKIAKARAGELGATAKALWRALEPGEPDSPQVVSNRLSRTGAGETKGIRRNYVLTSFGWEIARAAHALTAARLAELGSDFGMPGEPPDDEGAPHVEILWRQKE